MCNRFGPALAGPGRELVGGRQLTIAMDEISRINPELVKPNGIAPAVTKAADGLHLGAYRWWLAPHWWRKSAKELPTAFNAAAEKVATSRFWRPTFERGRRCLVPAEYFLEGRQPHVTRVEQSDGRPLHFAGLWDEWRPPDDPEAVVRTCTVITCPSNELMSTVHNRMPVILGPDDWDEWLSPDTPPANALHLLRPCPSGWLTAQPT